MGCENKIALNLHFYQPLRHATYPELLSIPTDPENKDWTRIITEQCYRPLVENHSRPRFSFDLYNTLLVQLESLDPQTASAYKEAMAEMGVGEAFIHPILPDLSDIDKQIVIEAGVKRFHQITGRLPQVFWPPETAIDTPTLVALTDNGYRAFICAPEQIVQKDGQPSDNRPTEITLPDGRTIIALPFDRPVSSNLAFNPKVNADRFVEEVIFPRVKRLDDHQHLLACTDAETFGHHFPYADKFLQYLLETALPNAGITPISVNDLLRPDTHLYQGRIVERSAWSCPHGNLIRWNGACDCAYGQDASWKGGVMFALRHLNEDLSRILLREIGPSYPRLVSQKFYRFLSEPRKITTTQDRLLAAKHASLVGLTSCITFFADPYVSGKINLLYAYQSLLHLADSGLKNQADQMMTDLRRNLSSVKLPNGRGTAWDMLLEMVPSVR